ncbi:unnamed protein product [Pseudo-nitzschia multistriata]|uniref:PRMT5 arginine-N-methyltransferase domain-containing protein n=1 Tax=Pseudo-nitzschia multistriata TaxID=183589 RepID=A0A448ZG95_9STRA|nr:unnamed protein product [Pseudo-nitzschia multistriata]
MGEGGKLVVGLHFPQTTPDASQLLQSAREDGYDYVTTALPCTERAKVRGDVTSLTGRWWRTSVVGIVQQDNSQDSFFQKIGKQIEWAIHMGIPAVILPPPPYGGLQDYARMILSLGLEAQASNLQIWIKTRLNVSSLENYERLHRLCDGLSNIGIILEMEPMSTMSSASATVGTQMILIHKAIGMQLKAITFPAKAFLTNKKGYPTLAKSHQVILTQTLRRVGRTLRVLIEAVAGAGRGPLVMRSIQAFNQLQTPSKNLTLKVYALEKNPSAVVYLRSMTENNSVWKGIVTVVNTDVRKLTRDHLNGNEIDIIVSELLGSFGDNELSPESLDCILKPLNKLKFHTKVLSH